MKDTPTDQLLRGLRRKVAAEFGETSLDRLYFRTADGPGSAPELVLQGATIASDQAKLEAQLETWLEDDEILKAMGAPVVKQITSRPNSLVAELRKLVARDPALDGVRVDRGLFDEENAFILSGRQDHEGQAEGVVALTPQAAAVAWPDLPPPATVRAGPFAVFPIRQLLDRLARRLPEFPAADGVILNRAYYNDASALALAGRASGVARERKDLEDLIRRLIGPEIDRKLDKLLLAWQPRDPDASERIALKGVAALVAGNLAGFPIGDLDEAIFLNPSSSTGWYLRGAYYLERGDRELALRDLRRVHLLEPTTQSSAFAERSRALVNFQGERRRTLDEMVVNATVSR